MIGFLVDVAPAGTRGELLAIIAAVVIVIAVVIIVALATGIFIFVRVGRSRAAEAGRRRDSY